MPRLSLALLVLFGAAAARAAPSCRGISVSGLVFGSYDVYSATPLDSAATISYSCPPPAVPVVDISAGGSGSFSLRRMSQAGLADTLAYNVYVDAARTTVWGSTPVSVPQGNGQSVPVYGRVFPLQDVSVGTYTDTLIVTFNF
ncbi:MAG: Csu type fimbrial protein [Myxococcales bacterium]